MTSHDDFGQRPGDPEETPRTHGGEPPADPNAQNHPWPDPHAPGYAVPGGQDAGYGGTYGGQVPGGHSAEGYGPGYGANPTSDDPYGRQVPGGYSPEGQGSGYGVPGGHDAGDAYGAQEYGAQEYGAQEYGAREYGTHQAGGQTYVPEPLAGPLPPYAEPGAPYAAPVGGDSWAGHAPAADGAAGGWGGSRPAGPGASGGWEHGADWTQAAAQPGGAEQTAVLPVVESLPQQTPGRHGAQAQEPGSAAQSPAQPSAPVRTGSPIIAPGMRPAALTAALGLLMAGGAAVGKPGLAVVLVVLQAVTAAGWFRLNGMWPARQGIALAFLSGVTADIGLLVANGDHGPEVLIGTLGVWLLLILVLQLRHHGSADERMSSLTATSASTLLTVLAAGCLATATSDAGSDPVVVGAVAVALAALARALPLPAAASVVVSLLAAAATGFATGPATGMSGGDAVLLAAACGVCALIGLRVASYDFPSRFVHFTAGVALPLTAAAPAVYVLGRVLTG